MQWPWIQTTWVEGKENEYIEARAKDVGLAGFVLAKGLVRGLSRCPNPSLWIFGTTQLRFLRGSIIADVIRYVA